MRIKNTAELVERAKSHQKFDRFLQGEYGTGKINGKATFQGCAIGCLATPVDVDSFVRGFFEKAEFTDANPFGLAYSNQPEITFTRSVKSVDPDDPNKAVTSYGFSDRFQVEKLEREFGICEALMRSAEHVFENECDGSQEGGEFVVDFAEAVARCEGIEITEEEVWSQIDAPGWAELIEWLNAKASVPA